MPDKTAKCNAKEAGAGGIAEAAAGEVDRSDAPPFAESQPQEGKKHATPQTCMVSEIEGCVATL